MPVPRTVQGASELARELGGWPTFHDAEVIELCLHRGGESILALQLVDPPGLVLEFALTDVFGLGLEEFNNQNLVGSLEIRGDEGMVMLRLAPNFGLSGWIQARAARVRARSGGPT